MNLLFNLALALGCSSNLCDCLGSLIYSQQVLVDEDVPRPASVPEGVISISTWFQANWKPDPQAFKLCKCIQY